jgi:predicted nuclease of predicted toxin-antitoxin system
MPALVTYLGARAGRVGAQHNPAQVVALRTQAMRMGRNLDEEDAQILSSALQERLSLITFDRRFANTARALGAPVESYPSM